MMKEFLGTGPDRIGAVHQLPSVVADHNFGSVVEQVCFPIFFYLETFLQNSAPLGLNTPRLSPTTGLLCHTACLCVHLCGCVAGLLCQRHVCLDAQDNGG